MNLLKNLIFIRFQHTFYNYLLIRTFQMVKNAHMRQIEQMESEELMTQKKLRTEVIQLEDMLAQVRKEYEMLRIEFEQNLAANEQTGPINKEMRNLIQSLQTHNVQLKVRNFTQFNWGQYRVKIWNNLG